VARPLLLILTLLGGWATPPASAQEAPPTFGRYQFDVWRAQDGVRRNLVQTRDGCLWLSSESGVTRCDGVRFKVFDGSSTPILQGRPRLQAVPLLEDGGRLFSIPRGGGLHPVTGPILSYSGSSLSAVGCAHTMDGSPPVGHSEHPRGATQAGLHAVAAWLLHFELSVQLQPPNPRFVLPGP